jgi:hypothetical protein
LYQAQHSDAGVILVDTLENLKIYLAVADKLNNLKALIYWGQEKIPDEIQKDSRVFTFQNFLDLGSNVQNSVIEEINEK